MLCISCTEPQTNNHQQHQSGLNIVRQTPTHTHTSKQIETEKPFPTYHKPVTFINKRLLFRFIEYLMYLMYIIDEIH